MYADRHARSSVLDPRSLGIAVVINGAVVTALLFTQPVFKIVDHSRILKTYPVPIEPTPPPLPPDPMPRHETQRRIPSTPGPLSTPARRRPRRRRSERCCHRCRLCPIPAP